ncbi:MAG: hypothetical protein KGH79_02890 [Patescibacteria group bacterium]|nr:hypothetical protein [Patescibacteria group bacterium]
MAKKTELFVVTARWSRLSKEEQVEEVRRAMANRHTNKSAARMLGTKPGIIAGIRWRNNIASTHAGFGVTRFKTSEEVARVDGPRSRIAPLGKECSYHYPDGKQCGYMPMEADPDRPELDLDRCKLHQRKKK